MPFSTPPVYIPTGTRTDVACSVRMSLPSAASARGVAAALAHGGLRASGAAASATSARGAERASGERDEHPRWRLRCSRASITTSVKSACTAPSAARLGGYSALSVSLARVLACAARGGAPPAPPGTHAVRCASSPQWRAHGVAGPPRGRQRVQHAWRRRHLDPRRDGDVEVVRGASWRRPGARCAGGTLERCHARRPRVAPALVLSGSGCPCASRPPAPRATSTLPPHTPVLAGHLLLPHR